MFTNSALLWLLVVVELTAGQGEATSKSPDSQFIPITLDLNFKANYNIQTFKHAETVSSSDVYESYHSGLATGLIRQTFHNEWLERPGGTRKFLYDSPSRGLIEFVRSGQLLDDGDELFHDDFSLFENGASWNSYQWHKSISDQMADLRQNNHYGAIKLILNGTNVDSALLLASEIDDETVESLDLDHYFRDDCLRLMRDKLHYINGVTRLLHLIECRRDEFKLQAIDNDSDSDSPMQKTRGQSKWEYRAKALGVMSAASKPTMDISVAIPKSRDATRKAGPSKTLEPGQIPLSIMFSLEHQTGVLINIYQFEPVEAQGHLSESSSAHSIYMMPLAHPDLSEILKSIRDTQESSSATIDAKEQLALTGRSFSFKAKMSGSLLSRLYSDPIDLSVSFDAELATFATQMSFTDRTSSGPSDGWRRSSISRLFDGTSGLQFHLMDTNFGYHNSNLSSSKLPQKPPSWRSCATSKLTQNQQAALIEGSELLNLGSATFMGLAIVRGIQCKVYERRLLGLPALLGLSEFDYAHSGEHLAKSEIYLNSYAYNSAAGHELKFVRLDFRIISKLDSSERMFLTLDVSAFTWAPSSSLAGGDLMAQECLLSVAGSRHVDIEFWFSRDQVSQQLAESEEAKLLRELEYDRKLRDQSLERMLANSLAISPVQQVDLETRLLETKTAAEEHETPERQLAALLYAKFSLYELWSDLIEDQFWGYARDLTYARSSQAVLEGARVHSYDECLWRAAHSLQPGRSVSVYSRLWIDDDSRQKDTSRMFMYCPKRLLCILGDSRWLPMSRQNPPQDLDELLEFPYVESEGAGRDDKCLVSSAIISQPKEDQQPTSRLEWWLENSKRSLGDRDNTNDVEPELERVRELRLELKVKMSPQARSNATPMETTANSQLLSLPMKVQRVKLTNNKIFANGRGAPANHADDDDARVGLIVKPLAGLAYLPGDNSTLTTSDGQAAPGLEPSDAAANHIERSAQYIHGSLAECSRACLMEPACNSFSLCHLEAVNPTRSGAASSPVRAGQVGCVFSRVAWSSARDFERLLRFSRQSSSNPVGELEIKLSENSNKEEKVRLKRSPLCSLHGRPQLDLFRSSPSNFVHQPQLKYLIWVRTAEQCARFCQERARVMRQLDSETRGGQANQATGLRGQFRSAACSSFYFSAKHQHCHLLPLADHWRALGLSNLLDFDHDSTRSSTASDGCTQAKPVADEIVLRWRRWFSERTPRERWTKLQQQQVSDDETEHYELDFEQVFVAHRNWRLSKVSAEEAEGAEREVKLQEKLWNYSLAGCASVCLQKKGCRSFGFQLEAAGESAPSLQRRTQMASDLGLCLLNAISAGDLAAGAWPSFKLERLPQAADSPASWWWHFEPSALALFILDGQQ